MSHTFCLLTMAWVTAQSPYQSAMPAPAQAAPARPPIMTHESMPEGTVIIEHGPMRPMPSYPMRARPAPKEVGLLPRLRRRVSVWLRQIHHKHQPTCECEPVPASMSMPIHRPHRTLYRPLRNPNISAPVMSNPPRHPQSQSQPTRALQQTSYKMRKPVKKSASRYPLSLKFAANVSHSSNYSCLNGQLFQAQGWKNVWVIRYANDKERDRFGGHFVLLSNADMKNFRHGDLVTVRGVLAGDPRVPHVVGYPMYRALDITLVERGN